MADPHVVVQEGEGALRLRLVGGERRPAADAADRAPAAVRRRIDLEFALLANTCGNGAPAPVPVAVSDFPILQLMLAERFDAAAAPLRRQAALALGELDAAEAVETLWTLAADAGEDDAIRAAAAAGLGRAAPRLAPPLLERLLEASTAPVVRRAAAGVLAALDSSAARAALGRVAAREKDPAVLAVVRATPRRRRRRAKAPRSDERPAALKRRG